MFSHFVRITLHKAASAGASVEKCEISVKEWLKGCFSHGRAREVRFPCSDVQVFAVCFTGVLLHWKCIYYLFAGGHFVLVIYVARTQWAADGSCVFTVCSFLLFINVTNIFYDLNRFWHHKPGRYNENKWNASLIFNTRVLIYVIVLYASALWLGWDWVEVGGRVLRDGNKACFHIYIDALAWI